MEGEDAPDDSEQLTKQPKGVVYVLNLALVLVIVIGLFAAAQCAVLYNEIASLPTWVRPFANTLLAFVAIILLYFGAKFVWMYIGLRISPRVSLALDEDLHEREAARQQMIKEEFAAARRTLTCFLEKYPLADEQAAELIKFGFCQDDINRLRATYQSLTRPAFLMDDREWLRQFEREFLLPLDEIAGRRTRRQMQNVFILTAASPRSGIDTLIVLVLSYSLVKDLCHIYNVRAGHWETAIILYRVVVNLVVASQMGDVGNVVGTGIGDWFHSVFEHVSAVLVGAAGKVLGKAAEGGVNTLLIWRLSVCTRAYLRPIRKRAGGNRWHTTTS